jgi:hypothetical protein
MDQKGRAFGRLRRAAFLALLLAAAQGRAEPFLVKPYVARADFEQNSFSLLDIQGRSLTLRQLTAQGEELDRFTLTK